MAFRRSTARRSLFLVAACLTSLLFFGAGSALASPPSAAFTGPATVPVNTPATFDASQSSDTPPSVITQYVWNFGDGSQSATSPAPKSTIQHSYSRGGRYTVTLTVVDSLGAVSQATRQIGVTAPPNAAFNPTQATVLAGSPVSFDGTQSSDPYGRITAYSWNFGDGGSSTAAQPSHSYGKTGTFTVTLSVTDNSGNRSSTSHQIKVIAPPPLQTLIETIAPYPTILRSGAPPSISSGGKFDLGERLFCPGSGPACRTTVNAHRGSKSGPRAGGTVLSTPADSSAEITFKLTKRAFKQFRTYHRLRLSLTMVSVRGGELITTRLTVLLKLR